MTRRILSIAPFAAAASLSSVPGLPRNGGWTAARFFRRRTCLARRAKIFAVPPTATATIAGVNAPVLFAGLAPTFAGLYQVNVQAP
jgi:hypothetical protein